ncbi:MAG TPA: hemin uptake protein HemP [Candidatus Udaeobacter sp.]|nr:hemin uptake protein HemP [Candidatus Udaeobacter sp.]
MIDDPGEAPVAREAPTAARASVRIASTELFRGRREVVIVHRGQEYRLHITKADKLILTK